MNEFLFSPTKQFIFPSGKILAGGKVYVFIKHTNTLATLYNDEGVEIANPVILDSNGRATVLADENYEYKMDVYTPDDELLFTATGYLTDDYEKDFAIISTDGSVDITPSISGYTDVWDLSVSGKLDTTAFERFYNDTYGPTVGDIYHKIDYISATVSGGYDSKLDVTAFNLYSAGVRGDLNVITGNTASISQNTAMLDDNIIQNMNNINAVSGGLNTLNTIVIPEIRTDIIDVSSKVDSVSAKVANKLDSTAFDDFISNSYSPNMSTIFGDIGSLKANKFDSSAFTDFINDSYGPNMSTIYQGLGNLSANKEDKITWAYNNDGEISAANGSALAGKGYYSKYAPYGVQATSGNLIIEGSRYPRQSWLEVSGENNVATAGIIPPVPEQNLSAVRYLVAASGSLADVSWKELPQIDTFSGVTTDSTLTGDGKNEPLGVADTQTMSSDESISITTAVNGVIFGVNSSWFDNAVNSAVTGTQGDAEVNAAVHNNSATWNTVTNKLDTTAFSTVSGNFVTNGDISATEWNSVYETVGTNSGSWTGTSVESYDLSAGDNIQINKDDVNSAIGIAVTGLNEYQTTAAMTGYATTGDLNTASSTLSAAIDYVSGNAGFTYTGIAPIVVNNTTQQISAVTWQLSAGTNITFVDDAVNNITRIDAVGGGYTPTYHYIEI